MNGKTGNLGDTVSIARDKAKLTVTAELPFSKRYLKYLTKKHLKKQQLREYLRVRWCLHVLVRLVTTCSCFVCLCLCDASVHISKDVRPLTRRIPPPLCFPSPQVITTGKQSYELKYYSITEENEAADEE